MMPGIISVQEEVHGENGHRSRLDPEQKPRCQLRPCREMMWREEHTLCAAFGQAGDSPHEIKVRGACLGPGLEVRHQGCVVLPETWRGQALYLEGG